MKTINIVIFAFIVIVMEILYRIFFYVSPIAKQEIALASVNGNAVVAGWGRAFTDGEASARPVMFLLYLALAIFLLCQTTTKNKNEK